MDIVRLQAMMLDAKADVRRAAARDICNAALAYEQSAASAIDVIASMADDDDAHIRITGGEGLLAMQMRFYDLTPYVMEGFAMMAMALHEDSRMRAITSIADIARRHPEYRERALMSLFPVLIDRDENVMRKATELYVAIRENHHEAPVDPFTRKLN